MIRRRARAAGISEEICCHTFRATGITAGLEGGASLEDMQRMANHDSIASTRLYDRREKTVSKDTVERIHIY